MNTKAFSTQPAMRRIDVGWSPVRTAVHLVETAGAPLSRSEELGAGDQREHAARFLTAKAPFIPEPWPRGGLNE